VSAGIEVASPDATHERRRRLDGPASGIVLHRSVALQHFRSTGLVRDDRFATTWRSPRSTAGA